MFDWFNNDIIGDEYLNSDSDVLDLNRIFLVDIFKVFDFLNLSIFVMKFWIFREERLKVKRVQFVGYMRQMVVVFSDKMFLVKGSKELRLFLGK